VKRIGVALVAGLLLAGCGADTSNEDRRQALEQYVAAVQPIRLGINELLDKADPILEGYRGGDIDAAQATRRMGALERGAADYAVRIAEVEPVPDEMQAAQDAYAHTFVLQDTYLSALTASLKSRAFDELPHFQNEQRAAIIAWRTRLQVLANRWGATLPANLQIAGRGEISPSPEGD
jgi:outer membrane murein-binding lipoprotein Lpp